MPFQPASESAPVLPRALYRAEQVRRLDRQAIEVQGIAATELMQRAGTAAYRLLRERWPTARRIAVLAGPGNNGGDGYVLARLAAADGLAVELLEPGDHGRLGAAAAASRDAWLGGGGRLAEGVALDPQVELIVDALFGTGLARAPTGVFAELIAAANTHSAPVLALDMPSGLDSDCGQTPGVAVQAAATVTFIGLKLGLFVGAGPDCRGALAFDNLGVSAAIYRDEPPAAWRSAWLHYLPRRRVRTAHKGDCGHVLLVGGAPGMAGAIRLAGEAALRSGAGLVSIATHPDHAAWLQLGRPELMVHGLAGPDGLAPLLARADVVAVGPGLGRADWGRALWQMLRRCGRPLVVDADALNLLAESAHCGSDWILTPHPGEAARLLNLSVAEVERDRPGALERLQRRYGGVVVLKGAGTLIGTGSSPFRVCSDGNPGMATAGAGDVLTGVIAALRAQGLTAPEAAEAGVCLHAAAGDQAARAGEIGLLAGDIIAELRSLANGVNAANMQDA